MRYIGNKTRLLPFIRRTIRRLRIPAGSAHDAFAGTASVGRALKESGWRVSGSDIMTYSYVFQRAYVVASREPRFAALRAADRSLGRALRADHDPVPHSPLAVVAAYLSSQLSPEEGFVTRHFAPAGGRMYFSNDNARRIDAARRCLQRWRDDGLITDDAYHLLLAGIIEGADRVANTAGIYAAYMKRWQPNALRPFRLLPVSPVAGPSGATAHLGDAATVARQLGVVDLLYVDPPYNTRQYAGYYHVPEILARDWSADPPRLRGKTGLLAEHAPSSQWCSAGGAREALAELLGATGARHVLVSYNSEGLLGDLELRTLLRAAAADGIVRRFRHRYRRYRADRDHERRRYRSGGISELLYYVRLR